MADETIVLRNHKDTVFNDLFSDKRNALSLFNALNGTDYTDVNSLEVVSISEAIYMRGKNDEGLLKEYLLKKKAEVKLMLLTEFDEELFAETMREEGFEEGFAKGEEQGFAKGEERLSRLYLTLAADKRTNDLERAMRDKDFRDTLYHKYGL